MELEKAINKLQEMIGLCTEEPKHITYNEEQAIEVILNYLKRQEKRISDLEFALMDMVLQFADESKDSINTMGLSALETAFSELDFDNPMPIKKVHEQYKKLAKQYLKKKAEESE